LGTLGSNIRWKKRKEKPRPAQDLSWFDSILPMFVGKFQNHVSLFLRFLSCVRCTYLFFYSSGRSLIGFDNSMGSSFCVWIHAQDGGKREELAHAWQRCSSTVIEWVLFLCYLSIFLRNEDGVWGI
jgi:hypothetical protein